MIKTLFLIFFLLSSLNAKEYFYERNKKITLVKDRTKLGTSKIKYFKNSNGDSIVVKKQMLIKMKAIAALTAIIDEFDLNIIKKINHNKYILEVKDIDEIFWKTNEINSRTAVEYAYPVYINKTVKQKHIEKLNKKGKFKKLPFGNDDAENANELLNAFNN